MAAFNHEHERQRLEEYGLTTDAATQSLEAQFRSLINERTGNLNNFSLSVDVACAQVGAVGFEQRGDLSNSYKKSVERADDKIIAKRYVLENAGYEEVKKRFFDLPPYSTILLFSPPPTEDMRQLGYGNYSMAYFYYILPGETDTKRIIKSLSWINYFDPDEQAAIINNLYLQPVVQPTEESILTNPVGVYGDGHNLESLRCIWDEMNTIYAKKSHAFPLPSFELFSQFILHGEEIQKGQHPVLSLMIEELARQYTKGPLNDKLQKQWNIMLNLAEHTELHEDWSHRLPDRQEITIFADYQHLAYQPKMIAGSCGPSGERDFLDRNIFVTRTFEVEKRENSSTDHGEKKLHCTCPFCKHQVDATITGDKIHCPACGKSAPYQC